MPEGSGLKLPSVEADGFVEFVAAGDHAAGEFRCSECGYGVIVRRQLPRCPMCGGTAWEARTQRLASRSGADRLH